MLDLPPERNRLAVGMLPTPFSAEEIRMACAPGRSNTYRIDDLGSESRVTRWVFGEGDETSAVSKQWTETVEGEVSGAPQTSESTWGELQAHASMV